MRERAGGHWYISIDTIGPPRFNTLPPQAVRTLFGQYAPSGDGYWSFVTKLARWLYEDS